MTLHKLTGGLCF